MLRRSGRGGCGGGDALGVSHVLLARRIVLEQRFLNLFSERAFALPCPWWGPLVFSKRRRYELLAANKPVTLFVHCLKVSIPCMFSRPPFSDVFGVFRFSSVTLGHRWERDSCTSCAGTSIPSQDCRHDLDSTTLT